MSWKSHFPEGDLWVFGYGSLIWKPPPHYDQRIPGYIEGYVRRFWQASTDHRGTPEKPGRVVTVIERVFWETLSDPHRSGDGSHDDRVWGAAYHIPASHAEEVHAYLDEREIDGYSAHFTPFHPFTETNGERRKEVASTPPLICMVYIGLPSNPQFLREEAERDPEAVARVIVDGEGQSGLNKEYLYLLEKALQGIGLGTADGHVVDLVGRVKRLEGIEQPEEEVPEEELAGLEVQRSLSSGQ